MKYIRTHDGIYDKVDETLVLASLPPQYELTKNGVHIGYEQCRKCTLADTIEELCDEFRYEDYAGHHLRAYYYGKGVYLDFYTEYPLAKTEMSTLKGAIWTDKGLIYVAKLNDKGEQENYV